MKIELVVQGSQLAGRRNFSQLAPAVRKNTLVIIILQGNINTIQTIQQVFRAMHLFDTVPDIAVVPISEVEAKISEEGYRHAKFSEVNETGVLRERVVKTLAENNYYSNIKLDSGQLLLKRRCQDAFCDKIKTTFELKPAEYKQLLLDSEPQHVVMKGKHISPI